MDLPPAPCVGCGWCCLHDQCGLSHRIHGYKRRCPELFWSSGQGRYLCRLADDSGNAEARRSLFIGQGCCARFNDWRGDVRDRDDEWPP